MASFWNHPQPRMRDASARIAPLFRDFELSMAGWHEDCSPILRESAPFPAPSWDGAL